MNRERLYRGKRKDNGAWIEGTGINRLIDTQGKEHIFIAKPNNSNTVVLWVEVIPKTVGEYTGLMDKNDKKIFKGDVIKTKKYGKVILHSNANYYDVFKVVYQPAVYRLENRQRGFNLVGSGSDYEVIGNIHDNPELLEVSK